jgi:ABC-type transport system involved in multi-copper enzyme maturation permease subunit
MSTLYRRISYSMKMMLSGSLWGTFLISILLAISISHPSWIELEQRSQHSLIFLMLIVMPVIAIIIFANSFAEELEEKLSRLLYAYPFKMLYVILERIGLCLILLLVTFALSLLGGYLGGISLSWHDVGYAAWRVFPASLFLGALSLLVSLLGRNMLAGLGAGIGYWFLELITQGQWTGRIFLFHSIWPINETISQNENSILLFLIGFTLLTAAIVLFHKARTWFI